MTKTTRLALAVLAEATAHVKGTGTGLDTAMALALLDTATRFVTRKGA